MSGVSLLSGLGKLPQELWSWSIPQIAGADVCAPTGMEGCDTRTSHLTEEAKG